MLKSITPQEAMRLIDKEDALLIDVREADEFAREHIEGARLMPLSVFTLLPPAPDRERSAIFYCRSGTRVRGSEEVLANHGFAASYQMEGGILGWKKAELPTISRKVPINYKITNK